MPRGKFFSQVASMLTANGRTDDIHHLLECVKTNDQNHAMYTDDIILAAVKELAKTPNNEVLNNYCLLYFCSILSRVHKYGLHILCSLHTVLQNCVDTVEPQLSGSHLSGFSVKRTTEMTALLE